MLTLLLIINSAVGLQIDYSTDSDASPFACAEIEAASIVCSQLQCKLLSVIQQVLYTDKNLLHGLVISCRHLSSGSKADDGAPRVRSHTDYAPPLLNIAFSIIFLTF